MARDTNRALELLNVYHEEFVKAARAIAGNHRDVQNYAEDYVQEAYLKLSKYDDLYDRIVKKGKATKGYMFFALRSIIINDIKKKSNLNYNHLGDQYDFEEKFMHIDEGIDPQIIAREEIENRIYEILERELHWFDFSVFKNYISTGKSFQTLAKETGLGVQTIYLSIKKAKLAIAENLYQEYLDYINGKYK